MALKDISDGKVKIYNPYGIYVTPYKNENEKGDETFFLGEVIRDTTTITQEDPTENKIENEFSSAPILNTVQLGSYTFSAEVADMQPALLKALCGYVIDGKKTYAPSTYTPVYAEISLVFKLSEGQFVAATLPKVQLNSKATFDSLSTSMGRITLAGTGLNMSVDNRETPFVLDSAYVRPNEIGLDAQSVTNTSFNVKATTDNTKVSKYEWYVNGDKNTDSDDTLNYSNATSKTNYNVTCRGLNADGESVTDTAYITVTTT